MDLGSWPWITLSMIRSGRAGGGESWENMQGMSLPWRGLRGPDKEENWELEIVVELLDSKGVCHLSF